MQSDPYGWQPISMLARQYENNLAALRHRDRGIAEAVSACTYDHYFISTATGRFVLGLRDASGTIQPLPNPVTPQKAQEITKQVYAEGFCNQPVLLAGMDQGWLWQMVARLPCRAPNLPGHRPPLYTLCRSPQYLGAVLHIHDWRKLIGDHRLQWFAGEDAVRQLRDFLIAHPTLPWPRLAVTIDPALWTQTHANLEAVLGDAATVCDGQLATNQQAIERLYADCTVESLAARFASDRPLRVLGITSMFTSFLQHSMRDWLSAMDALGHETQLLIESDDFECHNNLFHSQAVLKFKPDLLLLIDHYRAELAGLPAAVPCAMWVQDLLPNIFSDKGGQAQGPLDYCLGMGRLILQQRHGYPVRRFLSAPMGTNEKRFSTAPMLNADLSRYRSDLCYIGHASKEAGDVMTEQLAHIHDPTVKKLLAYVYEQMEAVYDAEQTLTHPRQIEHLLDTTARSIGFALHDSLRRTLIDLFTHDINNALFRHQTLQWAASLDVNLHLYGKGWEKHPRLAKFAKGIADNQTQLATIYRAAQINLQVTPHGAVHQRLLDGLAAGAFFLIRHCPGDLVDLHYRAIYDYCNLHGILNDSQLKTAAANEKRLQYHLDRIGTLSHTDPFSQEHPLTDVMRLAHDGQWTRCAATVWDDYDQVSFDSRQQLGDMVRHFLEDESARIEIAARMRTRVLERFTYRHQSQRLLKLIADDLSQTLTDQRKAG